MLRDQASMWRSASPTVFKTQLAFHSAPPARLSIRLLNCCKPSSRERPILYATQIDGCSRLRRRARRAKPPASKIALCTEPTLFVANLRRASTVTMSVRTQMQNPIRAGVPGSVASLDPHLSARPPSALVRPSDVRWVLRSPSSLSKQLRPPSRMSGVADGRVPPSSTQLQC